MFKNNFAFFRIFLLRICQGFELHRDGLVIEEERLLTNVKSWHDHAKMFVLTRTGCCFCNSGFSLQHSSEEACLRSEERGPPLWTARIPFYHLPKCVSEYQL